MSIDTNPELYSYAVPPNECPACYDANKSPDSLFLCFAGIMPGDNWNPGFPPPPNGCFEIPVFAPCRWTGTVGLFDFDYGHIVGFTFVDCHLGIGGGAFFTAILNLCVTWFANGRAVPAGNIYYGGHCKVVPPLAGGAFSFPELMALLSDDPLWAEWCNPVPAPGDSTVYKFYNAQDATNIKIKHVP